MNSPPENSSSQNDLQTRLGKVEELLNTDPAQADRAAAAVLVDFPGEPAALLYQGIARRMMRQPAAALEVLTPLCENLPEAPMPHLQRGLALRETGDVDAAVQSMRRAVAARADFCDAWLALGDTLLANGETEASQEAFHNSVRAAAAHPLLTQAAAALRENRNADAEQLLRDRLSNHPNDISALFMLADIAVRHGHLETGEKMLEHCLELAPAYEIARHNYALLLMRRNDTGRALQQVDRLLADAPENGVFRILKAAILSRAMKFDAAIELYQDILAGNSQQPSVWTSLGHALRTVGRRDEAIAAYRRAMEVSPHYGDAAWSLANLKTADISDAELDGMRAQLEKPDLDDDNRTLFHFALGRALEDRDQYRDSFSHYEKGNRIHRGRIVYDRGELGAHVSACEQQFTAEFFAERAGWGVADADPIFIVGLPRAGSTLVEQILASHPQVEGTPELPHLMNIAKTYADRHQKPVSLLAAHLDENGSRELGQAYLELTRIQRPQGSAHFIDKMPNNFMHLPLIRLILPNARIVDARRHPMACGFSIYKQFFAKGQPFSYSLEDIGQFYADYVKLMTHFDAVLPGYVHRIIYESLVDDPETEVRRLLEACGLEFDAACLAFHENPRPVSTASSEQVREPLNRDGLSQWQHYEPWLAPLRAAIGPIEASYRGADPA